MNNLTQKRRVGVAGGLMNQLMGNNSSIPKVGEGATILSYSDRSAYEVISVSEDNTKCTIRKMDTEFIGQGYGDEEYNYSSNEENETRDLEYNFKKGCWGSVYYTIEVIKSLKNKLYNEYGWDWIKHLPNGVNYESLINQEERYNRNKYLKLVDGITKEYKVFDEFSIIFGYMNHYQDPSF
tara:strand:- start:203 stop:745 length:543 start_codon:yes stop_codon:yes gene_type:complete